MSETATINPLTGLPVTNEQLKQVSTLAALQVNLELQIEQTEKKLAELNQKHLQIAQETLPGLMQELGLTSFKLENGYAIEVKPFIAAKIPEGQEAPAFKWLRDNNYDSIIKRQIALAFGKGEDKSAERVVKGLLKIGVPFTDKQGVHPQTLKAFCRERIEAGDGHFPRELFGVFEGKKTKITPPTK